MAEIQSNNINQFRNLITDDNFLRLRQLTTKFSIFDVMRATHSEIRHSNILAWLLNPYENHGCGDAFLRQLLLTISQKPGQHGLSFSDFYLLEIESVQIKREWPPRKNTTKDQDGEFYDQDEPDYKKRDRIDILIRIELKNELKPKNQNNSYTSIVIPIENKIRSKESVKGDKSQLECYSDAFKQVFEVKDKVIPLFLTPDGYDPTDHAWIKLDYEETRKVISTVFETYRADLGPDKQLLIGQYLDLLRDHIVSGLDPEVVRLCRILQIKHLRVMDEIRKLATTSIAKETEEQQLCQQIHNRNASVFRAYKNWQFGLREKVSDLMFDWMDRNKDSLGIQINTAKKSCLEFVSSSMLKVSKELFGKNNGLVFFCENQLNSDLRMIMQINSHEDQELRRMVYNVFQRDNSALFRSTDKEKISKIYTRIHNQNIFTPDEAIRKNSDKEVLDAITAELEKYFAPDGTYMQIQKFLLDHMDEFLALKVKLQPHT